ncbi:peptidase M48 [Noviherbaspirillum sedimenti]|uniref:Peptidase M48 n=2 Tax=Noviherbaspirillum sedimenti TaxID=2320865 RepID=A0A3A3FZ65_9BURK|nr:peptidase M48 [Noviherbaspirillum sedimenti]
MPPLAPTQAPPALPDKVAILRSWAEQQGRLYRVAAPLLINNTELCPRHARNLLGFTAKTRYAYTDEFAETAQSALGLDERLRVMNVLPGSGAEQAGLQKGDALLAIEIEPLPQGRGAERASASIIASELQGRSSISLTVLRDGRRVVHDISLTPACAMVIDLGNTDLADSYADGQRVMVTRGMLDSVASDEELAYVLAQEIAHNILAQEPRQDMVAAIDRLHALKPPADNGTAAGDIPTYPADIELRTRKLALYLLARAGYGIDHALDFWQRMANPPASDEFFTELEQTVGAIAARKQLGEPLVPEQP